LNSCLRLDLDGPSGPEHRDLPQPFAVIGRNAGADVTLGDRRVSRRHAYLQAIAGGVFCVDLGSRAGVFWDRRRGRSGWVDRERGVVINPFHIRQDKADCAAWESEGFDRPKDPLAKQSEDLSPASSLVLEFSHEASEPSFWKMNRLLTLVGRSPHCQVRLTAPGISRFHCSLVRTPTGVWAVDLLGRGGIIVNGVSVRSRRIDLGDELQVGSVLIRFRCDLPRVGIASTACLVPEIHDGSPATGRRDILPMPSFDPSRPPRGLTGPSATTGRASGPEVTRRVGASSAAIVQIEESDLVHFANDSGPGPHHLRQQEQMFDHFQQVMTMIVERFGDKHRDQMQVVREEITHIRQLSGELHSLHYRLSTPPLSLSIPDSQSPPGTSAPVESIDAAFGDSPSAVMAHLADSATLLPSTESGMSDPGPGPSGRAEGPTHSRSGGSIEVGAADLASQDMHGLIRRRMEALEREQKSHWQRILDLMRGPQTGPSGG